MTMISTTRATLCFLLAHIIVAATTCTVQAIELIVLNHLQRAVELTEPQEHSVAAGDSITLALEDTDDEIVVAVKDPSHSAPLPSGRYAVLVIDETDGAVLHDTNDLQVELSAAAHQCPDERGGLDYECMASRAFRGGMTRQTLKGAFYALWTSNSYWKLCNAQEPAKPLRQIQSKGGHTIDILRESPKVATIRNFITNDTCVEIMNRYAGLDDLTRARVGGVGATSTSEARETLTSNMDVDWSTDNILSRTAAQTFDVASEILGEQIPYEAQEPINFLHYVKGFEYKPHTDGQGRTLGDRVATTLIYCHIAKEGGGTVFPHGGGLRFQPENPGDLLYFEYQPHPMAAEHAACPVIEGKKSTFTQWYRLGVSADTPWWKFENWGEFHNPYLNTRWKGPRYHGEVPGEEEKEDNAGEL